MKNFKIETKAGTMGGTDLILINTDPLLAVVGKVKFTFDKQNRLIWINANIKNETPEQKKVFTSIRGTNKANPLGREELCGATACSDDCDEFIPALHDLEPLPLEFYEKLKIFGIEFNKYLLDPIKHASENNLELAIAQAIQASTENCPDKIIDLAVYLQENNRLDEYLKVLEAVPADNPHFKEANETIFDYYNNIDDFSTDLLSKRFKAAYYAELKEAEFYFSELAGEKGIVHNVPLSFGSNADLLISMALFIREKNAQINNLQQQPSSSTPGFFK